MNLPWSSLPFSARLGILVAIMAVVAVADYMLKRGAAQRWREYSFLLAAGAAGAVVGAVNDAMTSWLSPEYFVIGKGMGAGGNLQMRAIQLGAEAGFGAALIAGACYLLANNPKPGLPALPYSALLRYTLLPIGCALGAALVLGIVALFLARPDIQPELLEVISPDRARWFWRVWFIHLGLYVGLAIGVVWGILGIRRRRKAATV